MDSDPLTDANHTWNNLADNNSIPASGLDSWRQRVANWQKRVGETIESRVGHVFVLVLVTIDMIIVILDLGYEFLHDNCGDIRLKPTWLEVLSHISLGITCAFLLEIFLSLFAFGSKFYNPFGGFPLASLHLFDAFVIVTTFVLELTLKGREEEFAALLILLRFWRIVKLVEGKASSTIPSHKY
ncbi:hypothetical protein AGABI2DRAFT_199624 [Agaricus bisporus var. bisporus H97]|uniref:hypothetical protein n=1 Tax=Agaricus bisporus var. bisporus (strain H97 / ATCC MYA-4626 / FGSC 10389) TaxID=936046 RepID=UPI00029F5D15|nr:hypothetical protein AGABI2DRAFT_199624 [Agaricus bisporus var. bisporus H97]EKV50165.1 hypothetical protein AGABI2DRAFT_199624 [Agaricus bisporus var. bisporus H97]